MALINIEYGSLASSETMNKNFSYLEDEISKSSDTLTTSISSLLSNIATINGRLGEIAEDILDLNSKFESFKTQTKTILASYSMLPDWSTYYSVQFPYTTISQGYVFILPKINSIGNVKVNNKVLQAKLGNSGSSQLISVPVCKNDVVTTTLQFEVAYFVPVTAIDFEEDDEQESN